jgi:hypothetical protein
MTVKYRFKRLASVVRKKFLRNMDVDITSMSKLSESQVKAINIVDNCIKNNNSKLYFHHNTAEIQIQLSNIFITITQVHGFYECDIIFTGDKNQTSDKIIFDRGGIKHIYNKFHKEVERRMSKNIHTRDIVVNCHLTLILDMLNENKTDIDKFVKF